MPRDQEAPARRRRCSLAIIQEMTIQIPDDLARGLEPIAAAQKQSMEELAVERLRSLVDRLASPSFLLQSIRALRSVCCIGRMGSRAANSGRLFWPWRISLVDSFFEVDRTGLLTDHCRYRSSHTVMADF